jgi:hypothetical protein
MVRSLISSGPMLAVAAAAPALRKNRRRPPLNRP